MSKHETPQWQTPPATNAPAPRKRRRIFMWVFLAVQVAFLLMVILGAQSGAGTPADCGTLTRQECNDAQNVGTTIGVGLIIGLWVAVDVVLGITYAIIRLARR